MKVKALKSTTWHGNPKTAGQPALVEGVVYTVTGSIFKIGSVKFVDDDTMYNEGTTWYTLAEIEGQHHEGIFEKVLPTLSISK